MANISASIIDQQVRKLAEDLAESLQAASPRMKGDEHKQRSAAFVVLCVKTLLDLEVEEAVACLTDDSHDAAVDALHVGDILDGEFRITLFPTKYKQSLEANSAFPATEIGKLVATVATLFDPDKRFHAHERLMIRVEEIRSLIRDGVLPQVRVVLCNNGEPWSTDGQAVIDSAGFPPDRVTWEHLNPERLLALMQSQAEVSDELRLSGKIVVEEFNFRRVLIGKVPVTELAALFERHGDKLLERNIRRYLGLGANRVNRQIAGTLRSPEERPNFYFYNNGITVVCNKFRHNALQGENHVVRLENMQVINGGQTCHTIRSVLKANPNEDFSQAYVLLRLYELDDEQRSLIRDITFATNSQNPVDLRDLRANDPVQQRLEMGLHDLGVTYHRKRGRVRRGMPGIEPAEAAEAVLAVWRHKPHLARFDKKQHFGSLYGEIFREDLSPAQVIIAVEILREVEKRQQIAAAPDEDEDRPRFLPYASHFLAMLIGDLLLARMGIKLEELTHRQLNQAREQLRSFEKLYDKAVAELRILLCLDGVSESSSLQKLSGTFRRGDLLEMLPGLREEALAEANRKKAIQQYILEQFEGLENEVELEVELEDIRSQMIASLPQPHKQFIDWVEQAFGDAQN